MYGDTEAIRMLARDLRRTGAEIREESRALLDRAEEVYWEGQAAEAMRAVVRVRCSALGRVAGLHDDAAATLDQHAAAVDAVKALITRIEQRVCGLVAGARDRLAGLASAAVGVVGDVVGAVGPDPVDELLDRFVPPPSGHVDWLRVRFPGIDLPGLPDLDELYGRVA